MDESKITRREFNKLTATAATVPALLSLPKPVVPAWREVLEEKIREVLASPIAGAESKWNRQALVFAPGPFLLGYQTSHGEIVAQKTIEVNLGRVTDFAFLYELTNRVNGTEFCAAPPETLLLDGLWTEKLHECDELVTVMGLTFILRTRSHNEFWKPEGYWQRLADAAGSPMHPLANFDEIP